MAYSDLQFNQTISFNNLQSGVTQGYFVAKTAIPVSAKQITKAEADTYVNINTALPSYADKTSNQLVTRENLQGATNVFPYTIYALVDYGGAADWTAWKSIDGGNNFNQLTGLSESSTWTEIAGNISGTHIAVISKTTNNQVYISSNSGTTFSAISLNSANFYPYGVAMSNNGQYIAVSGFSIAIDSTATGYAKIAVSSDYGASFTTTYVDTTLRPYGFNYQTNSYLLDNTGKVSVSGDGQYITAVFGYAEFVGFPYFYTRPNSFRVTSSNSGTSWTPSGATPFAFFQGVALSGTGQYQFITASWVDKSFVSSANFEEGVRGYVSNNYGSTLSVGFFINSYSTLTYFDLPFAGISESGSSMVAVTRAQNNQTQAIFPSSNYGVSFSSRDGSLPLGLAVSLTPVSGITNSYVTIFDFQSQFFYSTDGGFTAWYTKATGLAYFKHIYRKALNTPELPYSYTLYYDYDDTLPVIIGVSSSTSACALVTNSITVYSSSSSIGVGTALYYDIYGTTQIQAIPSSAPSQNYYKISGNYIQFSNNYIINLIFTCSGPVVYTIDSFGSGSAFDACSYGSPSVTVYASSGYTVPMVGMIFYDSPSLTTPYVGGAGWRKFTDGVTNYAGEVDVNGELTNYVTC
jgi:hypothetical protein